MKNSISRRLFPIVLSMLLGPKAFAQTFIYCSEGSPTAFNPQITTDGTSHNAAGRTIYDSLAAFEYGTTKVIPGLAESWKVSKDGKTYTFNLRKGVEFHKTDYFTPTRPMNADDVIFSINRQRDPAHPYNKVNGGHYEYFDALEMGALIKDVKKINDTTVEVQLTRPEAPFVANMAMAFMSIVSKEYADQLEKKNKKDEFDMKPVGTGPFVFKSYAKDTIIRFDRHPKYFKGAPKIEKLVFAITPDANVRYQKLKAGECHLIIEPAPADLKDMAKNNKIKLISGAGLNVGYLAMNIKKKPFDQLDVRKAMAHALNRKSYIEAIYLGNAMVAKNPLPPTIWSYNNDVSEIEYSPTKAKELLKKAGFPNGFETEIWSLPVSRPYNPNGKKMAEMMQADLAQVGIKAKIVSFDWPTYLKKARGGEHTLLQMGWTGDNGDPDNFLGVLLSCPAVEAGSNYSFWCHKDFDKLLTDAKITSDVTKRTALYKKAQVLFSKELPWVPLAHSTIFRAMAANVQGYKIDPLGGDIFTTVELK